MRQVPHEPVPSNANAFQKVLETAAVNPEATARLSRHAARLTNKMG